MFGAEDGIRELVRYRGLGDGYRRQALALFLVTDADPMALLVIHQRRIFRIRKAAPGERHRCPDVHQGQVIQEQGKVVVGLGSACHFSDKSVVERSLIHI